MLLPKTSFEVELPCTVTGAVALPILIAEAFEVPTFTVPVVDVAVPESTVTLPDVPALALPDIKVTAEDTVVSTDLKAPPPMIVPLAVTVVAPLIAPALVIPPVLLFSPPDSDRPPVIVFCEALVTLNVPLERVRFPEVTVTLELTPSVPVIDELPVTAIPPA